MVYLGCNILGWPNLFTVAPFGELVVDCVFTLWGSQKEDPRVGVWFDDGVELLDLLAKLVAHPLCGAVAYNLNVVSNDDVSS